MKNSYNLPDDLVRGILVTLPVKSLLRFKCVCRNWCALITSSSFVNEHLHHKENPTRFLIYTRDPYPYISINTFMLPEKISSSVTPMLKKPSYLQIPGMLKIGGHVDGIFFLRSENSMALWNPATREFRPLPPYLLKLCGGDKFGFGFDSLSCDYKVVQIVEEHNYVKESWNGLAAVYSLSNDCWRNLTFNIDINSKILFNSLCSTCVNGVYYWCTAKATEVIPHDTYEKVILLVSFDMHNEVFGEIPGPDILVKSLHAGSLTLYNESLCLLVHGYDDQERPSIDIWLMNDEKLWTKVMNVIVPIPAYYDPRCRGFWGHDKVILEHKGQPILIYDTKSHEFTNLFHREEKTKRTRVSSYRESLVSIKK
ncbi:F-box/kelch-repeat protein like [Capsicum galapagoense]